jgi:hypothetical protein
LGGLDTRHRARAIIVPRTGSVRRLNEAGRTSLPAGIAMRAHASATTPPFLPNGLLDRTCRVQAGRTRLLVSALILDARACRVNDNATADVWRACKTGIKMEESRQDPSAKMALQPKMCITSALPLEFIQ